MCLIVRVQKHTPAAVRSTSDNHFVDPIHGLSRHHVLSFVDQHDVIPTGSPQIVKCFYVDV